MTSHTTSFLNPSPRIKRDGAASSIAHIALEQSEHLKLAPEIIFERKQALEDLLEESTFALKDDHPGPYHLYLKLEEDRFILLINKDRETQLARIGLSLTPLKATIHDYFLLCEGFYREARNGQSSQLETLDAGRRGIHNEGADWLLKRLAARLTIDHPTARRLFTLLCILHIRCANTFKKTTRGNSDDV